MSIKMCPGYRAICWLYIEDSKDWRGCFTDSFSSSIEPKEKYLGVCFGKYSRVIDFFYPSAKIASNQVNDFLTSLADKNIHVSPSLILCKPFEEQPSPEILERKIRAYTFLKPKSRESFTDCLKASSTQGNNEDHVFIDRYWNNSSYPLIEIAYGNSYDHIIDCIKKRRADSVWGADSSTVISLKVDLQTKEPVQDDLGRLIPAVIFIKSGSLSEISAIKPRKLAAQPLEWQNTMERFGSYDLCDSFAFKSLKEAYKYVSNLKRQNKNVVASSTLLLREVDK